MSYSVHLILDNLVYQKVKGEYTIAEMEQAVREMAELIDKANQACYILVDLSKLKSLDNNLAKVKNAVQPLLSHPNFKGLVAYGNGDSTIVNFMSNVLANLFKIPIKTVRIQDEAIAYLISQEASFNGKLQTALQKFNEQSV